MGIYEVGSSLWISLTVTDFEKKYGKKGAEGTNPTAPLEVLCLLSQGCRIKLSPIKRNERQQKGKV